MTKTLYLLRHAKSSWSDSALSDFDRPLNKRGKKAREHMASYMAQNGHIPDLIICSTAKRAMMTLDALRPVVGDACTTILDERLYLADPKVLVGFVENVDDAISSVMLIGHNPGLHMLALSLAEPSNSAEYSSLQFKYPTVALCILENVQNAWKPLLPRSFQLSGFVLPRDLSDS
jgi:phosphohistidine phosphatase